MRPPVAQYVFVVVVFFEYRLTETRGLRNKTQCYPKTLGEALREGLTSLPPRSKSDTRNKLYGRPLMNIERVSNVKLLNAGSGHNNAPLTNL